MLSIFLAIALLQNPLEKSNKTISSSFSKGTLKAQNSQLTEDFKIPSPSEVYEILISMQSVYPEGKYWTDASSGLYTWKGGTGNNREIANMGTGCVYFCFHLSDTAFGTLPARLTRTGGFTISDVRVGDLLRTDFNTHSVIVLQVHEQSVVIAEGNYKKSIHWGRVLSKSEVENADHLITRYPVGYVPPEDPNANKEIAGGSFGTNNQLHWSLNGAGYLKISGNGNCPDFDSFSDTPWSSHIDKVTSVIFESGVTSIGSNSFFGTNIYGLTIASTVKTIGDNAFQNCAKLSTVSIPEGTEIVGSNCFSGCGSLQIVTFPSTIKEVKDSALMSNKALKTVKFTPGDIKVTVGNYLFAQCYALNDLTLPTLMDKISDYMFFSSKMYYLYIPNGVESIGDYAFQQSNIATLVIPNTVNSIGMTRVALR